MESQNTASGVLTAVCVLTSLCDGAVSQAAINVAGQAWFARHSREDEAEADSAGVFAVVATGISPDGIPSFFETLLQERQREPTLLDDWFSSHPLEEQRVTRTRAIIDGLPAEQIDGLLSDDDEFHAVRARLQQLPPAPQVTRP
jgi:predicted Zn-dependent protease